MNWGEDFKRALAESDHDGPTQSTHDPLPIAQAVSRAISFAGAGDKPERLEARAETLAHRMLDRIEEADDRGDIDADDALQALPVLQRIREHAERMELQRADDKSKLPIIHFNIGLGHRIAMAAQPAAEVIEADTGTDEAREQQGVDAAAVKPLVFKLLPEPVNSETSASKIGAVQ